MANQDLERARQAIGPIGLVTPAGEQPARRAQAADDEWPLPGGAARVYYGQGNRGLTRPVLLADGFNSGPTNFDAFWEHVDGEPHRFATRLRERGRDLILIGFDDRSASILNNAQVATAAIQRAVAERVGDARLLVGGFSMGGIVTRYALARLELQRMDHQVGVYLSVDSPHRGASVPIALQAIAHHLAPVNDALSQQLNSPASRQLLWRHLEAPTGVPAEDRARAELLEQLRQVGDWPRIPRLLGVANGVGNGHANGVAPGVEALRSNGPYLTDTRLLTQAGGRDRVVAELRGLLGEITVRTNDFPDLDGAPGGTLESFGILADTLKDAGENVDVSHRSICFVPTSSAIAIRGIETNDDLYADIDSLPPEESPLDDFLTSSNPTPHSAVTEEISAWILDRLPD
ncbi:alpha/beta hydrolase [Frankia sp. AgPm24]|uniref:lipase family alpha/beta hydrolase n=1 Tax=Frankia sp. AgPm24 TaxID=631128 RepID=UPI00200DA6A4|nr:alpha/beta hydrolase [Frankia sp. AgPm24]MCK9922739.1 alpha/beta hydrolase [Frankia sp. AgPm24]